MYPLILETAFFAFWVILGQFFFIVLSMTLALVIIVAIYDLMI